VRENMNHEVTLGSLDTPLSMWLKWREQIKTKRNDDDLLLNNVNYGKIRLRVE